MSIIDSSKPNRPSVAASNKAGSLVHGLRLMTCVAASGLSALACGAAQEGKVDGDSALIEGQEVEVDTAELSQYLDSNEDTCGTAWADKNFTSVFSSFTTPDTYEAGKNDCWGAYFVNVDEYRTGDDGTKYNRVDWGGGALNTKAKCEAANLRVYVFVTAPGGRQFVDATSVRGVWSPAVTFPPGSTCGGMPCISLPASCALGINIDPSRSNVSGKFNLEIGKDYKFALSARDYTNPNAPVFKKIKLSSARRQDVL